MTTKTKGILAKDKLMDAATDLMIQNGFEATSVDDICHKAKVNRGSFFYYFKSKEDLGKEILKRFSVKIGSALSNQCCEAADPLTRVYNLVDAAIELSSNPAVKGCLVGTLSQEISTSHPELRGVCCASLDAAAEMIHRDLAEAKKQRAPKSKWDPKAVADYFVASSQGAMILMKARQDRKVIGKVLTQYKEYVKSLFEG